MVGKVHSRSRLVDAALLEAVEGHPRDLTRFVAGKVGVSRQTAATRARELVTQGFLARSGTTRPVYVRGPRQEKTVCHQLQGLAEDQVWRDDVSPLLRGLPANIVEIAQHGLTEMVNNAVDHAAGHHVWVRTARDPERLALWVIDDGVGIFRKISRAMDLPDDRLALLELAKGKLTTDPGNHTGEGVFFTSRMFDRFQIHSGDLVFQHDEDAADNVLADLPEMAEQPGTAVFMMIEVESARTVAEVFSAYSSGPDDYAFAKTVVPVRLARLGDENLVSRSQGKRLMRRVDGFRTVVLDFADVAAIGQAFADQVFRVFGNAHPDVELVTINAVAEVQQMICRAELARDRDNG